jgi:hypothetical protein
LQIPTEGEKVQIMKKKENTRSIYDNAAQNGVKISENCNWIVYTKF